MSVNWIWQRCRRWRRKVALLAMGALADDECAGLEAHLADCARCRRYRDELGPIAARVRSLSEAMPEVEPSAALRARWTRAVRGEPQASRFGGALAPAGGALRALMKRPVWAGLAAVWLLVLLFRVATPATDELPVAGPLPAPRELYLALTRPVWPGDGAAEVVVPPGIGEPKPALPKPRSQQQSRIKTG